MRIDRVQPTVCLPGLFLLLLALAGLPGCAHRPALAPAGSPASLAEREPQREPIARALREDPPLPGVAAEGWPGLQPAAGSAPDHRHHGHTQEAAQP
jgi:hypothetical protein